MHINRLGASAIELIKCLLLTGYFTQAHIVQLVLLPVKLFIRPINRLFITSANFSKKVIYIKRVSLLLIFG